MKVLIKDLSDRRAEVDGVILIFLVDADLDVDCGACTGLQSAADKPARLTTVPDTTCQIRYKITNSGACTGLQQRSDPIIRQNILSLPTYKYE